MQTSRVSSKGQVTLPKAIRDAVGVKPGDLIGYDVRDGIVTLRRVERFDADFHKALADTLSEWATPQDDEAFS